MQNSPKLLKSLFQFILLVLYGAALYLSGIVEMPFISYFLKIGGSISFIIGSLYIWVQPKTDENWVNHSKNVLQFWQAILVITAFLLLIYHLQVERMFRSFQEHTIHYSGTIHNEYNKEPLNSCWITLKFHDGTQETEFQKLDNGFFNDKITISNEAFENDVSIIIKGASDCVGKESTILAIEEDTKVLDIGSFTLECE